MKPRSRRGWPGPVAIAALISLAMIDVRPRFEEQKPAETPRRLALVGGMLLDGHEVPPLHHAAVLVEGNRITWVGRAADAVIPPDATVIDTSGRTMMPGMMDLHDHLMILGHGNSSRTASSTRVVREGRRAARRRPGRATPARHPQR